MFIHDLVVAGALLLNPSCSDLQTVTAKPPQSWVVNLDNDDRIDLTVISMDGKTNLMINDEFEARGSTPLQASYNPTTAGNQFVIVNGNNNEYVTVVYTICGPHNNEQLQPSN